MSPDGCTLAVRDGVVYVVGEAVLQRVGDERRDDWAHDTTEVTTDG